MSYVCKGGYLLGAIAVLALTSTADAKLASNRLAANKLSSNKLAANRLASNKIAVNTLASNKSSSVGLPTSDRAGEGAFDGITVIEFPNGLRLTR